MNNKTSNQRHSTLLSLWRVGGEAVFLLLLLASCHSSRYATRYEPPQPVAPTPVVEVPTPVVQPVEVAPVDTRTPLQRGIDQLLEESGVTQFAQVAVAVYDVTADNMLYERGLYQRMRPASTEKVVTAISALDRLGPDYTLNTQLLTTAAVSGNTLKGDLYLKGVMDPLLSIADVRTLVAQLKAAGITRIDGRLLADASFKDADEYGWGWCWDDDNPVLTPLLCGGKPGLVAQVQAALRQTGITLGKGTASATAPASARPLATFSRPLSEVLQPMLKESNNLCAEAVFYQMGRTRKSITDNLTTQSGEVIADGSGLSLYNYQTAANFIRLLAHAARSERILPALWNALPIAAVDGTLKKRMAGTPAEGVVRAKTGSVTAVSTLVGYTVQSSTGNLIAFAILTQGVQRMAEGRDLQDQICVLLTSQ